MPGPIKIYSSQGFFYKLSQINWGLVILILILMAVGATALYSAGGGSFDPWAGKQISRFFVLFTGMFMIAMIDIRWWYKLAWPFYLIGFVLLVLVEIMGHIGMGAQRWINLGFIQIQPSELMKISLIMVLARYFHSATLDDMRRIKFLIIPCVLIALPASMVLIQPDLGSAIMLCVVGAAMFFLAGASIWIFIGGFCAVAAAIPVAWHFLHEYQKKRVLIFLDPESDPLGAGYHITQSKIALGSGGFWGKGFLEGSQSHLNFLPEKQTDFVFTLWAEEWGFIGAVFLLTVFAFIFMYGPWIAFRVRHNFSRYMVMGLSVNFSVYIIMNIAMVMGLIPVVGEPLPMISYGGTAMMSALIGFGLMMSAHIHRDGKVNRI